jgi:hypothetical protein
MGTLGKLVFEEYGFSSDKPADLEWLLEEMLALARRYPDRANSDLVTAVMEGKDLGMPEGRYTIKDVREYAEYRMAILEEVYRKSPDIKRRPSDWHKLAKVTERDIEMALERE